MVNPAFCVQLTQGEYAACATIGLKRHALRMARSAERAVDAARGNREYKNIIGAFAEYALAKHYGGELLRDWCETRSFSMEHHRIACDLGVAVQVRATDKPNGGIIVHRPDSESDAFVLGIVDSQAFTVSFPGWIVGRNAKVPGYFQNTGVWQADPAYLVPQNVLSPLETLPKEYLYAKDDVPRRNCVPDHSRGPGDSGIGM